MACVSVALLIATICCCCNDICCPGGFLHEDFAAACHEWIGEMLFHGEALTRLRKALCVDVCNAEGLLRCLVACHCCCFIMFGANFAVLAGRLPQLSSRENFPILVLLGIVNSIIFALPCICHSAIICLGRPHWPVGRLFASRPIIGGHGPLLGLSKWQWKNAIKNILERYDPSPHEIHGGSNLKKR